MVKPFAVLIFTTVYSTLILCITIFLILCKTVADHTTVLPAKSDSDFMFCLQSYHGPILDRSLVY